MELLNEIIVLLELLFNLFRMSTLLNLGDFRLIITVFSEPLFKLRLSLLDIVLIIEQILIRMRMSTID